MKHIREQFLLYHGRSRAEVKACTDYVTKQWPDELAHRLRIADEAVNNIFLFDLPWDMEQTTIPVTFADDIDWQYQPGDDPEFVYQMNRHRCFICLGQAFAVTGREVYAECFVRLLLDWIDKNPLTEETKTSTWRTIEAGLRAESWIKGMGYMIDSAAVTDEVFGQFIRSLICHGEYLEACDVPFSIKSNWGVLENSGLYAIGKVTECLQPDCTFARTAKKRLLKQIKTQVMDDGVHWEQSPMYHNEVMKCLLEVLRIAGRYGDELPEAFIETVHQMARANRIWQRPDGLQPPIGDSDATDLRDLLTICAYQFHDPYLKSGGFSGLDYEGVWDYGMDAHKQYAELKSSQPERTFNWLKESGNWYLRSGWTADSDYLHVRCGSLGGGHGHFDKLHINLMIGGEEFFTDPGRYTYVDGDLRRGLKGSSAHNSIWVDDHDYSECLGSWDVAGLPPAVNCDGKQKGPYSLIQCGHLGYLESGIFLNRRVIAIGTRIFLLIDGAYGQGTHTYEQHFQIPANISVAPGDNGFKLQGRYAQVELISLMEDCRAEQRPGHISRHYNRLEEGTMLSLRIQGTGNIGFMTAIVCQDKQNSFPVSVTRVDVESPVTGRILKRQEAEAAVIRCGGQSYLVVAAHVDAGSDCEYIGACGCYGLGRVMAADLNAEEPEMTVLQW